MDPKEQENQGPVSACNPSYPPQYSQQPVAQYAPPPQQYPAHQGVVMQPMLHHSQVHVQHAATTKMPIFALVTSFVMTMVFFYWVPGFFCLVPALILGIAAMHKKENNDLVNARKLSILSFTLTIVHIITFPIMMFAVIFGSIYGSFCGNSSYYYFYNYRRC